MNITQFFDLLLYEHIMISDFKEYQQREIQWLMEYDIVKENSDGYLGLSVGKVFILKDLYNHDVICPQYFNDDLRKVFDEWHRNGDLKAENRLFSKPEQDYLDYMLNQASYSNGLELCNKYIHGTYPKDENIQYVDYIRLLKIMVLIVTKINEEFCLREQNKEISEK